MAGEIIKKRSPKPELGFYISEIIPNCDLLSYHVSGRTMTTKTRTHHIMKVKMSLFLGKCYAAT